VLGNVGLSAEFDEAERFAAYLRMLKNRSGLGFTQLGKRAGSSGSSLHRYCSGASLPADYRVVLAFAKSCGATPDEIRDLQRLWAAADASRLDADGAPAHDIDPDPTRQPHDGGHGLHEGPHRLHEDADRRERHGLGKGFGLNAATNRTRRYAAIAAGAIVLVLAAGLGPLMWTRGSGAAANPYASRLLFSPGCQGLISLGERDECVWEVQAELRLAGGQLGVDAKFGPETLRRVIAFQVFAGLPPKGVVDDATKRALYVGNVSLASWTPAQVERRIREVFTEDPDHALEIARCQSRLDPLFISTNTNGTRNWGTFQISDARLRDFGGTPRDALNPEWNIQAAHRLWSAKHDFRDWPSCEAALAQPTSSSPTGAPTATS
jgi:Helix-turn-helix domain/Putative peptidoglycan binding domain